MSIPSSPFPPSSTSSSNSPTTYNISGFEVSEETKVKLGLHTAEEVAKLSPDELKDLFITKQFQVLQLHQKCDEKDKDKESLISRANVALTHATSTNVIANMADTQQIRADSVGITKGTKIITVGRVISVVASVAVFVLTLVCILL